MPTPTIIKGEEHFFTTIYEGNDLGKRVGQFLPFNNQATVANSCLFNDGDSPKLERTPSSNGNRKTFTVSAWIKRGVTGNAEQQIISSYDGSSTDNNSMWELRFAGSGYNTLRISYYTTNILATNRTFEDSSKFYHIMMAVDTTQSSASDRVKLYVDGDEITSFSIDNRSAISQNFDTAFNNTSDACVIGNRKGQSLHFDGYMAEFVLVDGQQLLPASFGISDPLTFRWIPKTVEPYPTTTTNIAVTVVDSGGNKFAINGVTQDTITLIEGATYVFSYPSAHPFALSTTNGGIHSGGSEYVTGVTRDTSANTLTFVVPASAPQLYYYCTNHSGMGGIANTQSAYGVNGFRLTFSDSSNLGADSSGNSNSLTATNLASTDQTTDTPNSNHMTMGGRTGGSITLSEGNLKMVVNASDTCGLSGMAIPSSGKWYWEITLNTSGGYDRIGIAPNTASLTTAPINTGIAWNRMNTSGGMSMLGSSVSGSWGSGFSNGDIIQFALDADNKMLYIGGNNTWRNSGVPTSGSTGTGAVAYGGTSLGNAILHPASGAGNSGSTNTHTYNFGQKTFSYTPPTGFSALQQSLYPETDKGVTGFSIIKNRDSTDGWIWQDSVRGTGQYGGTAPSTQFNSASSDRIQKFLKGGFQIEDNVAVNTKNESYVAHSWVLNNGINVTDTSGDLSTELQVNTKAGVSVGKFTVSGSGNVTWAHGLGGVPEMGMLFTFDNQPYGTTYHHSTSTTPWNHYLLATSSQGLVTSNGIWGSAKPSSTLWTGLTGSLFTVGQSYMFYSFRGIEGFSKIGAYSANNSENGTFVYCGFSPSYLLIKSIGAISWYNIDATRSPINPVTIGSTWDNNQSEFSNQFKIDFLSNGFKIRNSSAGSGASTNSTSYSPYLFYAVAKNPFIGDGVSPATAR